MFDDDTRLTRLETALTGLLRQGRSEGNRVLITGGTGTLGRALTQAFLAGGYQVTVLNRDAHHQAQHAVTFPDCRRVLADICDYEPVLAACTGQDIVIHAAALKRVDTGEEQIQEFARVNIQGTRNVIAACQQALVGRALFISSDKAVAPLNFYGLTKAVGERLWCQASDPLTRFAGVRYGNVMGSNGSVLQLWQERLRQGLPILVREPDTTRFLMTLPDAVDMVLFALANMQGGEIFIPRHTPAFALHALAHSLEPDASRWRRQPLGPREKQHERLLAEGEYWEVVNADYARVLPQVAGHPYLNVPGAFCSEQATRLTSAQVQTLLEEPT